MMGTRGLMFLCGVLVDRKEVHRILHERLNTARKRCDTASDHFDQATKGKPIYSSLQRIEELRKACHEYSLALGEFKRALKAHHEFLKDGTIPADLR